LLEFFYTPAVFKSPIQRDPAKFMHDLYISVKTAV